MINCICCSSKEITGSPFFLKQFYLCRSCGLIFKDKDNINTLANNIVCHYHEIDPHKAVANSKKAFFEFALNYLDSKIKLSEKRILDIGCGYGYFLNIALKRGWEPHGIEIAENAAKGCREKIGNKNIFHGKLSESSLAEESFDAITLWDVLVMVNDPYEELKECHRILKKDGIIGIRVRNVVFQKLAYFLHLPFKKIYGKFGVKHPTVFHAFCFSPRSIEILLLKTGFTNIRIENSPLTSGDPYAYGISRAPVQFIKTLIHFISNLAFTISRGKWIIGPSLLIWAEKP